MINLNRQVYDREAQFLAVEAIARLRPTVILPPSANAGSRFFDDEYVLSTLESQTLQKDFLMYPMKAIEGALLEAAKADYWYRHDKDWGAYESDFYEKYQLEASNDESNY